MSEVSNAASLRKACVAAPPRVSCRLCGDADHIWPVLGTHDVFECLNQELCERRRATNKGKIMHSTDDRQLMITQIHEGRVALDAARNEIARLSADVEQLTLERDSARGEVSVWRKRHEVLLSANDCVSEERDGTRMDRLMRLVEKALKAPSGLEIVDECLTIAELLVQKNIAYGDSALAPKRVFSKLGPLEQIKVRIDDKLSRIGNGNENLDEDTVQDLIGYLVLYRIAGRRTP